MKPVSTESAGPATRTASHTSDERGALAGLALCTLLAALGTSSANVALPTLMRAFNATFQQVQWVVLAYLLAVTTLIVAAGRLADITGRKRLLSIGIALFAVASVLCALAPTFWLLIAARAGQGLGAAILMALGMAMIGQTVPRESTGRAMGLLGTMSALGTALGPTAGGILIDTLGWQAVFLVKAALCVPALWLARRYLPADMAGSAAGRIGRFDYPGTLLLALTLAAYALAMTLGSAPFGPRNAALLAAAALGATLFVMVELRTPSPVLHLALFSDRALAASLAMSVLVCAVMMATLVVGPFYLATTMRMGPAAVGLVMAAGPVAAALAGLPAGRLADRFGAARMALASLVGLAAGALCLALIPARFGVPGYLAGMVLMTVHFSLFQAANNAAVMREVQAHQRALVSALLNLARNLGFITGAAVLGAVFASAGMGATFGLAALLIAAAMAAGATAYASARALP